MGLLKSLFVGAWMTLGSLAAVHAGYMLVTGGYSLAWLGALIANLPIPLYLGYLYLLMSAPRTNPHLPQLTVPAAIGSAMAIAGWLQGDGGLLPASYAVDVAFIGGLLYTYWYSVSPGADEGIHSTVQKGSLLPDFEVTDNDGKPVHSNSIKGSYALLMFYRGNWCPLCMAQIREVAREYDELAAKGVKVMLVSPQPPENTQAIAKKFNVPMTFLIDKDNAAAKALGILNKNGLPVGIDVLGYDRDVPYPSIILVDPSGKVISAEISLNYRVRPHPREYLAQITAHQAAA